MKTANEIQLEALAEAYDERCCDLESCRTVVENIITMCEKDHNREIIAKYAKELLEDIDEMIEGKNT